MKLFHKHISLTKVIILNPNQRKMAGKKKLPQRGKEKTFKPNSGKEKLRQQEETLSRTLRDIDVKAFFSPLYSVKGLLALVYIHLF